jgi:hypothetical protein
MVVVAPGDEIRMAEPLTPPWPLAILPNGEAVRPDDVRRILIETGPSLVEDAGQRFQVVIHLSDGISRVIATGLSRADAVDLSRRCARAVNDAMRQGA